MTDQRRLERFLSERINKFKKHDDALLFMHYYMRHAQNASILGTQLQIRTWRTKRIKVRQTYRYENNVKLLLLFSRSPICWQKFIIISTLFLPITFILLLLDGFCENCPMSILSQPPPLFLFLAPAPTLSSPFLFPLPLVSL